MVLAGRFRVEGKLTQLALCLFFLVGCPVPERFKQPAQQDGKYLVHVVSAQGETVTQISEWYADGAKSEKAIVSANAGRDLGALRVGDRVLIPFSVVKRLEPLGPGLPRPERKEGASPTAEEEEVAPAGAALDDDFVDLEDGPPAPPTPTAVPAVSNRKAPSKPAPVIDSRTESAEGDDRPQESLDPLEALAASAERAQRSQPPGVPVGISTQSPEPETFDEQPETAAPAATNRPRGVGAAQAAPTDPNLDQLRRELGLTQ